MHMNHLDGCNIVAMLMATLSVWVLEAPLLRNPAVAPGGGACGGPGANLRSNINDCYAFRVKALKLKM